MARFSIEPLGPFTLAHANRYFGGWPTLRSDDNTLVMAFPVEGWRTSAAVVVRQEPSGVITGDVIGADGADAQSAWRTAQAAVSLDHDGTGFADVGKRDAVIGRLQDHFGLMRPVCFSMKAPTPRSERKSARASAAGMAQGILIRGAGLADEVSDDKVTAQAVQHAYDLASPPDRATLSKLAEPWRPFRAWAMVLLHMWLRREGGPSFQRPGRQSRPRSRS